MRLSRHCYDKSHRCPGWRGGGVRFAKVDRCDGGHIQIDYSSRWKRNWRFHRCDTCDVVCWPIVVRELDWRWWGWRISNWRSRISDWRWWWIDRGHDLRRLLVLALYTKPLRFGELALKLDERWKTNVWELSEEEQS